MRAQNAQWLGGCPSSCMLTISSAILDLGAEHVVQPVEIEQDIASGALGSFGDNLVGIIAVERRLHHALKLLRCAGGMSNGLDPVGHVHEAGVVVASL